MNKKNKIIIQENIPCDDSCMYQCLFFCSKDGEIINEFLWKALRQSPPLYGVTKVGKSDIIPDEIIRTSKKLLKQIKYHGIANL